MTTKEKIDSIIESRYKEYNGVQLFGLKRLHEEIRLKIGDEKFLEFLEQQERDNPRPTFSSTYPINQLLKH